MSRKSVQRFCDNDMRQNNAQSDFAAPPSTRSMEPVI